MVCGLLGCGADVVSDGFDAVNQYDPGRHSIVLCDYVMEPANGIYVVSKIKEIDPQAKCIMVSGFPDAQLRRFVEENQLFDLIVKPIRTETLKQTLRLALEGKEGATEEVGGIALSNRMDDCPALSGDSPDIRRLRDQLTTQISTHRPFLLVGENAGDNREIAEFVHRNGSCAGGACVVFDCAKYAEEEFHSYLIDASGGLGVQVKRAEKGTLILQSAEVLPLPIQRLVADAFDQISSATRLILLAQAPLEDGLETGAIDDEYYFKVASNAIEVPRN